MLTPHSPRSWFRYVTLLVAAWLTGSLPPQAASAQRGAMATAAANVAVEAADTSGVSRTRNEPMCEGSAVGPGCAPDQRLELDAARPARRFASYSDLVALVRGRVSLGLALAPFPSGPLTRVRFELEVVTRLRGQRGVELTARLGVNLLGQGLDGLFASATGSYIARVQPGGQLVLGAELGYARHFASLFVSGAAGVSVGTWSRSGDHRVAPSVRILLGHAFY